MACCFSTAAGIIVAIQFFLKAVPWIYENFIGPIFLGPKLKLHEYGEWALVTGATDGIGKSYAKQLAQQGINIILISRTTAKLEGVAKEIESESKVKTKIITIDFGGESEIYDKIENEIKGMDIGILVNNVGVSYAYPEYFLDVADRDKIFDQIIKCNMTSVVNMCKIVLPIMLKKQKGIIINNASLSASIHNPLLTVYSASKAFVDKFSGDLGSEYKKQGIIVQSILPGFVATNMTKLRKTSWLAPSSDKYVAAALRTIGYAKRTTGYYPHALMQLVLSTLYAYLPELHGTFTLRVMEKVKNKSLKLNKKFAEKAQ